MTMSSRSPVLTIDCNAGNNKRSLEPAEDENDLIYRTPLPATAWSKRSRDAHCFSPPPTPRGKRTASRHVFAFDTLTSHQDLQAANILLPELAVRVASDQDPVRLKYKSFRRASLLTAALHHHGRNNGMAMPLPPVLEDDRDLMPPPADKASTTTTEKSSGTNHDTASAITKPDQHQAMARNCWTPNLPDKPSSAWKGSEYARCA
jgi:hypothetical protein